MHLRFALPGYDYVKPLIPSICYHVNVATLVLRHWAIYFLGIVSFLLLISSCGEVENKEVESPLIPIREALGYVVPQDSISPPVTVVIDESKLKKRTVANLKRTCVHSGVFQTKASAKIKLDKPHVCIPGREGFVLPFQQSIFVTPVPAPVPDVVQAKPMQVMDSNPMGFRFYQNPEGLDQANIRQIMQDHLGNLWLATTGGFIKYDGKFFSNYKLTKDISDWSCYIHEDTSRNIWFGTQKGLVRYDGKTFAYLDERNGFHPDHLYYIERSGAIWVAPTSGGITKLIPVVDNTNASMQFISMHFGAKEGFTDAIIDKVLEDRTANLWFLFRDMQGMIRLKPESDTSNLAHTFLHYNMPGNLKKNIPEMIEDHDGYLWFSGTDGLWKMQGDSLSFFPTTAKPDNNYVAPLYQDTYKNIWGKVYRDGIVRLTLEKDIQQAAVIYLSIQDGLSNDRISSVFEDKSGNIWIGTENGLNVSPTGFMTSLTEQDGLAQNVTRSILEDRSGNLWFGSGENGASQMEAHPNSICEQSNSFIYYNRNNGLSGDDVFSIIQCRNDDLWFGTIDRGVFRYSLTDNNEYTSSNFDKACGLEGSIYCMMEDAAGTIWIGEYAGYVGATANVYRYTPAKGDLPATLASYTTAQGMSDKSINSILEDNDGNIWFATWQGGVTKYTPPNRDHPAVFTHFTTKEGLTSNEVRTIVKDFRGNLWLGTSGDGLIFYNGKSFVAITEKEGLSNNYLKSSLSDHAGNLWFGTEYGLNKLDKNIIDTITEKTAAGTLRENDIIFHTYTYEDGFVGTSCWSNAIAEDRFGIIWVGTEDRVTGIHPEAEVKDTTFPTIQLTGIDLFNESMDWQHLARHQDTSFSLGNGVKVRNMKYDGLQKWCNIPENLSLMHQNNYITFHFIGITMNQPGKVKYQYKLDGNDDYWSKPVTTNFATYGNLSPGHYRFRVKAINSEGFKGQELIYPLIIRYPWWQTWWAYGIYLLLTSAAVYVMLSFFKRRVLLQQQLKTEKDEAIRLKELDTFKSQLFTNLTHEFRTPLTVILGMTKQLAARSRQWAVSINEKNKVGHDLQLIENNGKNLLQLINQLLDLSKLENKSFKLQQVQSDIISYLRYLTESFLSLADDLDLSLRFTSEIENQVMDFDPEQIKQIMTNLISNALKFTPPGGEVVVNVTISAHRLQVAVKDTGIGIAEKDLPHILDRFYQADSSSTRVAQGTGIGLAHTQELLKVMDGSLIVESELGNGTIVTIRLPVLHHEPFTGIDEIFTTKPYVAIDRPLKEEVTDDQSALQRPSSDAALPQLLIIEDNRDVVEYLKSCLESSYQVIVAYDGKSGVETALEQIPDFIISDVMMPLMDGFQVCDRLKNDEHTSHIPLILLTAKADAASRLTGLRRGADAYMAKPFSPEELDLQITTLLENRKRMAHYFSRTLKSDSPAINNGASIPEEIQIEDAFIKKVKGIIELHYTDEQFALPQLCDEIGMSRSQLFRKMKAIADISPSDLIRTYRLQKAKELLEQGDITVAEVTYKVGFKDPSYFTKMFQEEYGRAPSKIT